MTRRLEFFHPRHVDVSQSVDPGELPTRESLDAFAAEGITALNVDGVVSLDEPAHSLVSFLRDAQTLGFRVHWRGYARSGDVVPHLVHLQPPIDLEGCTGRVLREWRDQYRFGTFYWRHGPGFVVAVDSRNYKSSRRLCFDDPTIVALFESLLQLQPTLVRQLADRQKLALDRLVKVNLVTVWSGAAIVLPYRLEQWPLRSHAR